jgi:hypothetical protein
LRCTPRKDNRKRRWKGRGERQLCFGKSVGIRRRKSESGSLPTQKHAREFGTRIVAGNGIQDHFECVARVVCGERDVVSGIEVWNKWKILRGLSLKDRVRSLCVDGEGSVFNKERYCARGKVLDVLR